MKDNNKAYWDALIRGMAWPNQEKPSRGGWYILGSVLAFYLLISLV